MESNESFCLNIQNNVDNTDFPFDWAFGEFNIDSSKINNKEKQENNKIKKDFVYVNNLVVNPNKKIYDSSPKWKKMVEKNSIELEKKNSLSNSNSKSSLNKKNTKPNSKESNIEDEPFNFP